MRALTYLQSQFIKKPTIIALLSLVAVLPIYIGWFLPGVIIGGDFQYRSTEYIQSQCQTQTWNYYTAGGSYTIEGGNLAKQPIFEIACGLSSFTTYEWLQVLIWLAPLLLLLVLGPYFYFKERLDNPYLLFFAIVVYASNPVLLERIHRSHFWLAIVVALFPLGLLMVEKKMYRSKIGSVYLALFASLMIFVELRMAILALGLLFFAVLINEKFNLKALSKEKASILRTGVLVILLNSFWLLPALVTPASSLYDQAIAQESALIGASKFYGSISNAILNVPSNWEVNILPTYYLLSVLFVAAIWLLAKHKKLAINTSLFGYSFILFILMFLSKGSFEPFAKLNIWLLKNIPLFISFRNSTKFAVFLLFFMLIIITTGLSLFIRLYPRAKLSILLPFLAILFAYSGGFFILKNIPSGFAGNASQYGNEPNTFYPLEDRKKSEIDDLYRKVSASPSKSFLMLPRDQRHRLLGADVQEIKLKEAQEKTGLITSKDGLLSGSNDFASNFLRLASADGVILHNGSTPEWSYSKSLTYSKSLAALLNLKDLEPLYEIQTAVKPSIKERGDSITLEYDRKAGNNEQPKTLLLNLRYKVPETITIKIYPADNPENHSLLYEKLGSSLDRYVGIDLPLTGQGSLKIEITDFIQDGNVDVKSAFIVEQTSNAFTLSQTDHSEEALVSIGATPNRLDGATIDKDTGKIIPIESPLNSVNYALGTSYNGHGYLKLSLLSEIDENLNYKLTTEKRLVEGSWRIRGGGVKNTLYLHADTSYGEILDIALENIFSGNSIIVESIEKHDFASNNLPDPKTTYTASEPIYLSEDAYMCRDFQYAPILEYTVLDDPREGVPTVDCTSDQLTGVDWSTQRSDRVATVDSNVELGSENNISIRQIRRSSVLLFNYDFDVNWSASAYSRNLEHLSVNKGKNGWFIDVNDLCVQRQLCTQNADGSWDIDLVIEFEPQRWFYVGSIISGSTFVGIIGYLGWDWRRGRAKHTVKKTGQINR